MVANDPAAALFKSFQDAFSEARMRTYEYATGGDKQLAVDLYGWNVRIGAAFLEDLCTFEVLLRNALDRALRAHFQQAPEAVPWYDQNILHATNYKPIDEVLVALGAGQARDWDSSDLTPREPDQDDVVAALGFGFWRNLLDPKYQGRMWGVLRDAFPHPAHGGRPSAAHVFSTWWPTYMTWENAIAHCNHLLSWDLARSVRNIDFMAGSISPRVKKWLRDRSKVGVVIDQDPRRH